jgi:uncharacterized membrane protein YkoI
MGLPTSRTLTNRLTLLALCTLLAGGAQARDRGDHERARDAVVAGQILPLRTVLDRLEREQAGQVLEIELESDDNRWIYEVKLLQPGGRLLRLEIDAGSGEVIGRRVRSVRKTQGDVR